MAMAMAYPDDGERGRGKKSLLNNDFSGVSSGYVRQARFVLRNNPIPENQQYPDLCLSVMAGTLSLTEAYTSTQEDVRRREEEARIQNENLEKLAGIREQYPDIAQERVIIFANPPKPP